MEKKIKKFVESNLAIFDDPANLTDDTDLFSSGFVNSLFAMKLVNFIEQEFQIPIGDEDLDLSNFSSINKIVSFIEKKRQ